MSLAPGEQRSLAEIENHLSRTDPVLVAMFTHFTAEGLGERPLHTPGRRRTQGRRARMIILAALSVALIAASIAVAVAVALHRRAAPGARAATGPVSAYISAR
jgi:hypothetical protein